MQGNNKATIRLSRNSGMHFLNMKLRHSNRCYVAIKFSQRDLYKELEKRLYSLKLQKMEVKIEDKINGTTSHWRPTLWSKPAKKPKFVVPDFPRYIPRHGKIETIELSEKEYNERIAGRWLQRWTDGKISTARLLQEVEFTS